MTKSDEIIASTIAKRRWMVETVVSSRKREFLIRTLADLMPIQLDSSVLGALRCFEEAGRLLSFTKAAAALNLTQSAVSQQIRHLEERLGYRLFDRQARGLALTAKGATLWTATSKALLGINHTLKLLAVWDTPLQISCLPSFALQWLMPRLSAFQRVQPQLALRLTAEYQSLDRVTMEAGGIEAAVRYDPIDYPSLHAETILDEYLVAVATPAYLARHPVIAEGVCPSGVVLIDDAEAWDGAPEFIEARTWVEGLHPSWKEHLTGPRYNLSALAIGAALNEQGIAVIRSSLVYDELSSGRLVKVLGRHVAAPARYVLLSKPSNDPRVRAFAEWLKAECQRFDKARMQLLLA